MTRPRLMSAARRWLHHLSARRLRVALAGAAAASVVLILGAVVFHPPEIEDLSEENRGDLPSLFSEWEDGDVIVLLRHLERCDKEDYPCLEGTEGVTARSASVGTVLAKSFGQLGLDKADIYNSPLTRTAQTEQMVFDDVGLDEDWLYKCRETMLRSALEHKVPGKNLILVTHSSCISAFEQALGYDTDTPEYGTALFFARTESPESLNVLGFLDADDWQVAFESRKDSSPRQPEVDQKG